MDSKYWKRVQYWKKVLHTFISGLVLCATIGTVYLTGVAFDTHAVWYVCVALVVLLCFLIAVFYHRTNEG